MFEYLHLDLFSLIFDYLTQQELLDIFLINQLIYRQIIKYVPNKLLEIKTDGNLDYAAKNNLIISIKLIKINVNWDNGLWSACLRGNIQIIELIIKKGANRMNLNFGFYAACLGGNMKIVELMIEKGANNWNLGLNHACEYGNIKLAELMIEKGANDWYGGLCNACQGGHMKLAELMIEKGANHCDYCHKSLQNHLQMQSQK